MKEKANGKYVDEEPVGAQACDPEEAAGKESYDNVSDESFESNDNPSCDAGEWQDKYVRLSAEFDNYRKRTLREKMDLISTASEDVIKSLLGIMDDIDRAAVYVEASDDIVSAREGVALIRQKMDDMLRSKGVSEIKALGEEMDADLFEAVARIPVPEKQKGKVVDVVQKGYKLNDKIVRYAKVVVGE